MALTLPNAKKKITTGVSEATAETIYTATANQQKISSIRVANIDTGNIVYASVFIDDGVDKVYIQKESPINIGAAIEMGGGINVASPDVIKAYSDAADNIDIIVSFAEIS